MSSLFLDFDGTLVELADRPDAVVVDEALPALLSRLSVWLDGRVAIVSGRSIEQLDGFLPGISAGLALIGSHGGETREVGGFAVMAQRPAAMLVAERVFVERLGMIPGVVIEVKALGVGIHYRLAPDIEEEAAALVAQFAGEEGLMMQHGKMMKELRLAGHDKGTATAALASRPPFAGHLPIFVGDDVTDESGFAACAALGGGGILIGEPRETAARWCLPDVASLHAWLGAAL